MRSLSILPLCLLLTRVFAVIEKNTATTPNKLPKFLTQLSTQKIDTQPEHSTPTRQQRKSRFFPPTEVENVDGKGSASTSHEPTEKLDTDNTRTLANAGMSHIVDKDEDAISSTVDTNYARDFYANIDQVGHGGPNAILRTPISGLDPAAPRFMSKMDNDAFASTLEDVSIPTGDRNHTQSFHARPNQFGNYDSSTIFGPAPSTFNPAAAEFFIYDTEGVQLKRFFLKMEQQWLKQKQLGDERMKNWHSETNYDVNVQTALNTITVVFNYLQHKDPRNSFLPRTYDHGK